MCEGTRVLIVDDHALMREGLRSILERDHRFEVAGEAATADEALRIARTSNAGAALVDISLPGQTGIDLTRRLCVEFPEMRILVVTMHSHVDYITEAFQAGAHGFIVKDSASDQLLHGLEVVLAGKTFIDSALSPELVRSLTDESYRKSPIQDDSYASLTPREQEILRLVAEGLSAKEVAAKLFISPKTVDNHRSNIMRKLDLHTAVELMRYAARIGLIDISDWTRQ